MSTMHRASHHPQEQVQVQGYALRVLVVDDDEVIRDVLDNVFSAAGFDVQLFACAADLLAAADLTSWGLLLLDVKMPGMSGPELHAVLRQRACVLPVIFLTGQADIGIAVNAMHNGAVDFIEKPFIAHSLIERARKALAAPQPGVATPAGLSSAELRARWATLTPRENQVWQLMVTGMGSKTMARQLGGSFRTIDIHRARVMQKMAAANLAELVRMSLGFERG